MENQQKVWDKIAKNWNECRTVISPTVKKFLSDKTGNILDVGCGSGRNFVKIDGLNWSAIDFSESMINFAHEKAKKLEIKLDVKQSVSWDIPFGDNYFDAVLCHAVLHCIETPKKRKKTLEEIYRVLKKDGVALISSWGMNSPRLKEKEGYVSWTIKEKEEKQMRYTYVFDLNELVYLCKEIGFEIVESWEERNVNVIVRKK